MAAKDQEIESLQERHHVELKVSARPLLQHAVDITVSCIQAVPFDAASHACLGLRSTL